MSSIFITEGKKHEGFVLFIIQLKTWVEIVLHSRLKGMVENF